MQRISILLSVLLLTCLTCQPLFAADCVTIGSVRVQLLSDSLVRLEVKGPEGFEDRNTFHILNRDWSGTKFGLVTNANDITIQTANYSVRVPQNADSLTNVAVLSADGQPLYSYNGDLQNSVWLPAPSDKPSVWSFADTPRLIPPAWGLTPPPQPMSNGGWDLSNNVPDVYVFIPHGDYYQLRKDFLKLTGPTEMPPLYLFGSFDSRWYDYTEATALKQIGDYRSRQIPLDVLVIDTGWRKGASTGYLVNTNLFPNMARFIKEAHKKDVKVLFNDHPSPLDTNVIGLDAKEMSFRYEGLSQLLQEGLDIWWYDRNWYVALIPPAPNLRKETWGMRLYHDTTERVRPDARPLIMANVDGIDNGTRNRPMDVSSHRYPFQWTGDIGPTPEFLRRGVENAVHAGVQSLFPYMSEDLGGHTSDPAPEGYIRWIEYGALSPVYRPHCTHNHERMPWAFGTNAEIIARNFLDMRYRLLPVFYAAAHENYETGEPLLRRLDLEFPEAPEARRDDEYLLGKNILVAPVLEAANGSRWQSDEAPATLRILWVPPGDWIDAWTGQTVSGPTLLTNTVPLDKIPVYIRAGAVLPLAPQMQFTSEKPWNPITLDLYPRAGETNTATLYEDDTKTTAYQHGEFRTTEISLTANDSAKTVTIDIGAAKGKFQGELKRRSWVLRLHKPLGRSQNLTPMQATINDKKKKVSVHALPHATSAMPFGDLAGAPDEDVYEWALPAGSVSKETRVVIQLSQ
jgi:alpha-glucosidase (family GH31 glycosyl hydrolase)